MAFLPKRKFGFVMFANSEGLDNAHEIVAYRLIDDHLTTPSTQRSDWAKFLLDEVRKDKEERGKGLEELFPRRPAVPLPMTLPLDAYNGRFKHPGYGIMTVSVRDGKVFIDATDRTYRMELRFEHVSADFFIAYLYGQTMPDYYAAIESEFRVGVSGGVEKMGIDFVGDDGGEMVWFKRILET